MPARKRFRPFFTATVIVTIPAGLFGASPAASAQCDRIYEARVLEPSEAAGETVRENAIAAEGAGGLDGPGPQRGYECLAVAGTSEQWFTSPEELDELKMLEARTEARVDAVPGDLIGAAHMTACEARLVTYWVLERPEGGGWRDTDLIFPPRVRLSIHYATRLEGSGDAQASTNAGSTVGGMHELEHVRSGEADGDQWSVVFSVPNPTLQTDFPEGSEPGGGIGYPTAPPFLEGREIFGRWMTSEVVVDPERIPGTPYWDPGSFVLRIECVLGSGSAAENTFAGDAGAWASALSRLYYSLRAVNEFGVIRQDIAARLVVAPRRVVSISATAAGAPGSFTLRAHMPPPVTVFPFPEPARTRSESLMRFFHDTNGNGVLEELIDEELGLDANHYDGGWTLGVTRDAAWGATARFFAVAENACGEQATPTEALFDLDTLTPNSDPAQQYGRALANVGDIDGDGWDDLAIGAPLHDRGRVELRSGRTQELLREWFGRAEGDRFGWSVAGAGDLDGDGVPDLVIGAPDADPQGLIDAGTIDVFSGATGARLFRRRGAFAGERFGWAVDAGRDLNGDDVPDIIIGAPHARRADLEETGAVYLHDGATGTRIRRILGRLAGDRLGSSVALVGDLNGDGMGDFAAGAPYNDDRAEDGGRVTVYSGALGAPFFHRRGGQPQEHFGWAILAAGDLDLTSRPDIIVSGPGYDRAGHPDAGRLVAYDDRGRAIWTRGGAHTGGRLGHALAPGGDFDCDGVPDLIAGAAGAEEIVLLSGLTADMIERWETPEPGAGYGTALTWLANQLEDEGTLVAGLPDLPGGGDTTGTTMAACPH